MSDFPRLKTNAIAQYPSRTGSSYRTGILRFIDGKEQRFRKMGEPRREWVLRLDQLDETEVHNLRRFFEAQRGSYGTFRFTDPWTGIEHEGCGFESDLFQCDFTDIYRARTTVRIRQVLA